MQKLRTKIKKQGGFTLVEMLIVVAIIAILIAVSIPLVSSALERASKATDAANERSAKAVATVMYLTMDADGDDIIGFPAVYDAEKGILIEETAAGDIVGYGKCTSHKGGYITVSLTGDYDYTDSTMELFEIEWSVGGEISDSKELITGNGEITP